MAEAAIEIAKVAIEIAKAAIEIIDVSHRFASAQGEVE